MTTLLGVDFDRYANTSTDYLLYQIDSFSTPYMYMYDFYGSINSTVEQHRIR